MAAGILELICINRYLHTDRGNSTSSDWISNLNERGGGEEEGEEGKEFRQSFQLIISSDKSFVFFVFFDIITTMNTAIIFTGVLGCFLLMVKLFSPRRCS